MMRRSLLGQEAEERSVASHERNHDAVVVKAKVPRQASAGAHSLLSVPSLGSGTDCVWTFTNGWETPFDGSSGAGGQPPPSLAGTTNESFGWQTVAPGTIVFDAHPLASIPAPPPPSLTIMDPPADTHFLQPSEQQAPPDAATRPGEAFVDQHCWDIAVVPVMSQTRNVVVDETFSVRSKDEDYKTDNASLGSGNDERLLQAKMVRHLFRAAAKRQQTSKDVLSNTNNNNPLQMIIAKSAKMSSRHGSNKSSSTKKKKKTLARSCHEKVPDKPKNEVKQQPQPITNDTAAKPTEYIDSATYMTQVVDASCDTNDATVETKKKKKKSSSRTNKSSKTRQPTSIESPSSKNKKETKKKSKTKSKSKKKKQPYLERHDVDEDDDDALEAPDELGNDCCWDTAILDDDVDGWDTAGEVDDTITTAVDETTTTAALDETATHNLNEYDDMAVDVAENRIVTSSNNSEAEGTESTMDSTASNNDDHLLKFKYKEYDVDFTDADDNQSGWETLDDGPDGRSTTNISDHTDLDESIFGDDNGGNGAGIIQEVLRLDKAKSKASKKKSKTSTKRNTNDKMTSSSRMSKSNGLVPEDKEHSNNLVAAQGERKEKIPSTKKKKSKDKMDKHRHEKHHQSSKKTLTEKLMDKKNRRSSLTKAETKERKAEAKERKAENERQRLHFAAKIIQCTYWEYCIRRKGALPSHRQTGYVQFALENETRTLYTGCINHASDNLDPMFTPAPLMSLVDNP